MTKTIINLVPGIFTRGALVGVIQTHKQDHDANHPPSARSHGRFPLVFTVGLMTVGVIAIISLFQLLSFYLG